MNNRLRISKQQLTNLILKYDMNKGIGRTLFGDTVGITELKEFANRRLVTQEPDYYLTDDEINELQVLLLNRYSRLSIDRDYRNSKTKLTNIIYTELANLIANGSPRILALVQTYYNNCSMNGIKLININQEIFVSSSGYALPVYEMEKHIGDTDSFTHPIPGKPSNETIPLSEVDIETLNANETIKLKFNSIREKFSRYQNEKTFMGEYLYHYPKDLLFVTEDNYCFLTDEIIKILDAKNKFFNPYISGPFNDNDLKRIVNLPEVINATKLIRFKQRYCASKITNQTIAQLIKLTEDFLITHAFNIHAQAYGVFNEYYRTLDREEKEALDDYWVEGFPNIYIGLSMVPGGGAIKFKDLYRTFNASCTFAASLVKMIFQLDPNANVIAKDSIANVIIATIKSQTRNNKSEYVTSRQPEPDANQLLESDNGSSRLSMKN